MNKEKIIKEIDSLLAFWLSCECKKCKGIIKLPSKEFPTIFEFLLEIQ